MSGDVLGDSLRDRVFALRTIPEFAGLDDADLTLLAERSHFLRVRAGTMLMRHGAPIESVYLLVRGAIHLRDGAAETVLDGHGSAGILHLLAGRDAGPSCEVLRDATLLELSADSVLTLLFDSVGIARYTLRESARALIAQRGGLPSLPGGDASVDAGVYHARTPTWIEKILVVRRAPLWEHVKLDAVAELARHMEELRVDAGATLWELGDPATHGFRVQYGILRATNAEGVSVRIGSGQLLGGLEAMAGIPRTYTLATETRAILFRIDAAAQLAVMENHPQVAARLRLVLANTVLGALQAGSVPPRLG